MFVTKQNIILLVVIYTQKTNAKFGEENKILVLNTSKLLLTDLITKGNVVKLTCGNPVFRGTQSIKTTGRTALEKHQDVSPSEFSISVDFRTGYTSHKSL